MAQLAIRIAGFAVETTPGLSPGEVRFFPRRNVMFVGSGVGVDEDAKVEAAPEAPREPTEADLDAEIERLEAASRVAEKKAKLDALRAGNAG